MSNSELKTYATTLVGYLREIDEINGAIKDLTGSAKDAGLNVKALRKVARELLMETDKRDKLYEDEDQLEMFREAVGLTGTERLLEAAE